MPMPALQEIIHRLEVGAWTRYVKVGVALLGFLVFAVVYDVRCFKNFATQEAMDSAQLARNLSRGRGFTTDFVRPLSLYLLQRHQLESKEGKPGQFLKGEHPDLANGPVYPLLLAGWMKILPFDYSISKGAFFWRYQPEVLVAGLNQIFFFVSVLLVFALARKLFDAPVAWVSAAVFAGADLFWKFSVSGLSTSLLTLLFLVLVWLLVLIEENHREGTRPHGWLIACAALAGLVLGLGTLSRYAFIALLLPVLGFLGLFLGQRRIVLSIVTAATCLAVVTPWLARNYKLSGTFFGVTGYTVYQETTPQFRGNKLERYMSGDFELALAKVEVDHFLRKFVVNLAEMVRHDLPTLGGSWLTGLFLVGLLVPFLNPTLNRVRVFLLFSLVFLMIFQALGKTHLSSDMPELNSENLLVLVAPVVFIFGVAMFFLLLDQINLPFPPTRTIVAWGFGIIVSAPLIFTMLPPRSIPVAYPPYWPPLVQDVSSWMKTDELMMSDMPWAVAWYGERKCLWATLDAPSDLRNSKGSDFFAIHDFQKPIQGILLTRLTTDAKWFSQMIQGQDFAWGKFMLECLLRTNVPNGFPLTHSPPGFLQEGLLFLSDKERWALPGPQRKSQPH